MEAWKQDSRREVVMTDLDALVPKEHLLRKIEKVLDYDWLYELLDPYYCHDNGRPGIDPVVLIKMVLLQHLYGIPSLRQTYERIKDTISYRWFLGYSLLDNIPHFATVSYAFCNRFPAEVVQQIFEHILNKAVNLRAIDPSKVFIDGTHIKASANKKKYQKEQVTKTAKVYTEQLLNEVNDERAKLGKKAVKTEDDDENDPPAGGGTVERTVSTTDPECGMFVKGEHEKQFAYEAHTACDKKGYVLGVEVTAGNIHDSIAFDPLYEQVTARFPQAAYFAMDSAYKTPWIAKRVIDDGRVPVLPYKSQGYKPGRYKPWEYRYHAEDDHYTCPRGGILRHTTTDAEGKRSYRSIPKECRECPVREKCGANEKGQKLFTRHIWQGYLDDADLIRKTDWGKEIYAMRKETIERVFADAKEKHGMRYTHHRGLARVTNWVRLKFAAMNLKKLAVWAWRRFSFSYFFAVFVPDYANSPVFA